MYSTKRKVFHEVQKQKRQQKTNPSKNQETFRISTVKCRHDSEVSSKTSAMTINMLHSQSSQMPVVSDVCPNARTSSSAQCIEKRHNLADLNLKKDASVKMITMKDATTNTGDF